MRSGNRKSKRNVLLLKSGDVAPPLSLLAGDYDRWFAAAFGQENVQLTVVQAHRNQRLPAVRGYDAVIMTGSPLSITQPSPWMFRAAHHMLDAAERGVPVLGVCFGHQLLAKVLGGEVFKNPKGRETGTVQVDLTDAGQKDALFDGIPRAPPKATILAGNANTDVQAAAFGPRIRGVQFHPELSAGGMHALIEARLASLDAEGVAAGETPGARIRRLGAALSPAPFARKVLTNFIEHFT
jgi:GMP synthase (glutamine-hydrolysing)